VWVLSDFRGNKNLAMKRYRELVEHSNLCRSSADALALAHEIIAYLRFRVLGFGVRVRT
jgi:hypothetical protein